MWALKRYLKNYRLESLLAPVFKFLEASFELLVPLVMAGIIDKGIAQNDRDYVIRMGLLLFGLACVGLVSAITSQFFSARAAAGFGTELRNDLFRHILGFSQGEIDQFGKDTLITRVTNDSDQVQNGVNRFFRLVLRSPLIVFGALFMAFSIDTAISLIFLGVIGVLTLIVCLIMGQSVRFYRKVQQKLDLVLGKTSENLSGIRVIRAFSREEKEVEEYRQATRGLYLEQFLVGNVAGLLNPLTYVVVNLGIVAILQTGAVKVNTGSLTQGQVVALVNYMSQILVELVKLANLIILLSKASACAKRINGVFAVKSGLKDGERILDISDTEGALIEFDQVGFCYPKAQAESLSSISFQVDPGDTSDIIGGTGSGKSTLACLLLRFYDVTSGCLKIAGRDIREYTLESLRSTIGLVEQKSRLFRGNIRKNLTFGGFEADAGEMDRALEMAQGTEVVANKQGGLEAVVTAGGNNFSGGQKQRLSIARTLVRRPKILILDDSSSALDYATDARLRQALAKLKDTTVFIISQRVSSLRNAKKILVLDDGKMAGFGSHTELLENNALYREICRSQEEVAQ